MNLALEFPLYLLNAYMLVFCRMAGVIVLNPIFSRRNVPPQLLIALCMGLTIVATPPLIPTVPHFSNDFAFLAAVMAELIVGVVWGMIFQFFFYMLFTAGDAMDMSMGLAMARVLDQDAGIQASTSGNLFNLIFSLYIFATNSHLVLIRLAVASYDIVGLGGAFLSPRIGAFMIEMFIYSFNLAIRLALPFLVATFAAQVIIGILMKLVPQINVFTINFQVKIILAIILLFMFIPQIGNFIENYMTIMFEQMERSLYVLM